jgi:hypothetical protein
MITVKGQLTDQLLKMNDLIFSLFKNPRNLFNIFLRDYKKLLNAIGNPITEVRIKSPQACFL